MSCSRSGSQLGKKVLKQINAQLKAVVDVYPTATFVVLLGGSEEILDYYTTRSTFDLKKQRASLDNMFSILSGLRHSVLDFGVLLKQKNIQPIVTVRGAHHSFLCYPVGNDKLLAFYVDVELDQPLNAKKIVESGLVDVVIVVAVVWQKEIER
mmetsp:Transcript_11748/g.19580  ORF Transcript_11748/g.19580 Transcript_11748/m.19580 type:complete len:153 (+) Transcript_11748:71-529(+)